MIHLRHIPTPKNTRCSSDIRMCKIIRIRLEEFLGEGSSSNHFLHVNSIWLATVPHSAATVIQRAYRNYKNHWQPKFGMQRETMGILGEYEEYYFVHDWILRKKG
ncbi:unnamed protein product [Rhizophagus irregularis]|nr:unnamed protein product [Rhizophagus irregularis]